MDKRFSVLSPAETIGDEPWIRSDATVADGECSAHRAPAIESKPTPGRIGWGCESAEP